MNSIIDPANDNLHIEFQANTRSEKIAHRNLLEKEVSLRNLRDDAPQTLAELKIYLHKVLLIEKS